MPKQDLKVRSASGAQFDCYLVTPESAANDAAATSAPAVVLASAIHGVDQDLRNIADSFAAHGYIVAAPDLFWRTVPGPLTRDDPRSGPRGKPRLPVIKTGEQDLIDVLTVLRAQPHWNGRVAVIGFCYGGPYAVLGPARLGYDAGMSLHGTQMLDYIGELGGVAKPVVVIWGEQDHLAPAEVLDAYRALPARMPNVELHVLPGVEHGYMMHGSPQAYDQKAYDFSMERALAMMAALR